MNKSVEHYFSNGCGRCALGGTPDCKVHQWPEELKQLRRIVLECGLTEESKWGVPCYTFQNRNIAIVSAFTGYASLSFFKGSLLKDEHALLHKQGEESQAARLFKFTNWKDILALEPQIKAYLFEAIEIERAGLKIDYKDISEYSIPDELNEIFKINPAFHKAFISLTPGRQRGYLLHFSGAKQPQTKKSRIEKCIPKIMKGKGLNEY